MPERYQTLEELLKRTKGAERYSRIQEELDRRIRGVSAFRTEIEIGSGRIFFTIPTELAKLSEKTLRVERRISTLWKSLPAIAQWASLRSLIMDEIVSSNEIEGVHSTRRQIGAALDILDKRATQGDKQEYKKFKEFASLYLNLTEGSQEFPREPKDIRRIYDAVASDDLKERDQPDGRLFRAEPVDVHNRFERPIHTGVYPEERIISMIGGMLELVDSEEIPELYSAILSHFIFEYIHPFYDGNGRTGRYLLALYLSRPLSVATVLSLSRTIAENKKAYYKAFEITENQLNHAEGTFFILEIMKLIRVAQDELLSNLEEKSELLELSRASIFESDLLFSDLSEKAKRLLYQLAQESLFAALPGVSLKSMSSYLKVSTQTARKYIEELETNNLVDVISKRPLTFKLSKNGEALLGFDQ